MPIEVDQVSRDTFGHRRPGRALMRLSHESIDINDRQAVVDLRFRAGDGGGEPVSAVAECREGGGAVVADLPAGARTAWLRTPRSRSPLRRIGDRGRADLSGPGPMRLEFEMGDEQAQVSTQWVLVMAPVRPEPDSRIS